jgi:hypothetical protein
MISHRTKSASERAAVIAAEDAAREAAGRLPHSFLGAVRLSEKLRSAAAPPLTDEGTDTIKRARRIV